LKIARIVLKQIKYLSIQDKTVKIVYKNSNGLKIEV